MTVVSLLQQLIQIPSVNPEGREEDLAAGEQALACFLADLLQSWGFETSLEEVLPERPNLIARAPGSPLRPRILLGPHLDTVPVEGMTVAPFAAEIREGKIWGRGASDTKGPMAAMLMGLYANREQLQAAPVAIDFVAFMGEETKQLGSKHFAEVHGKSYDFALVGEPTSLDLVHTTKGCLWATLAAKGLATHASQPQLGENAIMKLVASLEFLNRKLTNQLATFTHPVLGHSTQNIGTIAGGVSPNIVPEHAEAQLDIRFTPDLAEAGGAKALLEETIAQHGLPVEIAHFSEAPPMDVPVENTWLQKLLAAAPQSSAVGAPWFSDAAHLNAVGLPAICVGPGSIDQAHSADEFITIEDLEAGEQWFTQVIAKVLKSENLR